MGKNKILRAKLNKVHVQFVRKKRSDRRKTKVYLYASDIIMYLMIYLGDFNGSCKTKANEKR